MFPAQTEKTFGKAKGGAFRQRKLPKNEPPLKR
jgi:hypothetical protein